MALPPAGPFKSATVSARGEQQSRSQDEHLHARQQCQLLNRASISTRGNNASCWRERASQWFFNGEKNIQSAFTKRRSFHAGIMGTKWSKRHCIHTGNESMSHMEEVSNSVAYYYCRISETDANASQHNSSIQSRVIRVFQLLYSTQASDLSADFKWNQVQGFPSISMAVHYFIQIIRYMFRNIFPPEDGRTTDTCGG
jgi:hypothetical protein